MKLSIKYYLSMTYCGSYAVIINILSLHINIILKLNPIVIANLNIFELLTKCKSSRLNLFILLKIISSSNLFLNIL